MFFESRKFSVTSNCEQRCTELLTHSPIHTHSFHVLIARFTTHSCLYENMENNSGVKSFTIDFTEAKNIDILTCHSRESTCN